ncbi:MAG: putative iron-sulfur cluster-binding metallochaperone [Gammaproteobacteria bacterium]
MTRCCEDKPSRNDRQDCPACGTSSRSVELITVLHHVKFPSNQQLEDNDCDYYYCPNRYCDIGYFSTKGSIPKSQLCAYEKIHSGFLCYCFDISEDQYRSAMISGNSESIKNFVISKTRSGQCACTIKNPSGQCCVSAFKAITNNPSTSNI